MHGGISNGELEQQLFFVAYVAVIVLLGMLTGASSVAERENFFNQIIVPRKHFLFVFVFLWLLFFVIGFRLFMHGYDYAPSVALPTERVLRSSVSGFEFSGQLLLAPFLIGYFFARAILFVHSKKFLSRM